MHNNQDNFTRDILQKIEDEHITPLPRWRFTLYHVLLWIPGTCVTLIGTFAWGGLLFGIEHAGWQYQPFVAPSKIELLVRTIPLLWVISFLLFATLIVKTLRITPRGYRFDSRKVLGISVLISLSLGTLLYLIDMRVYRNPIIRYPAEQQHKELWSKPAQGQLAGLLSLEEDMVYITDFTNKEWVVNTSFLSTSSLLVDNSVVRLIGKQIDDETFLVCMVYPWKLSLRPHIKLPPTPRPPRILATTTSYTCDTLILGKQVKEKMR